jgi:hypothetical protein
MRDGSFFPHFIHDGNLSHLLLSESSIQVNKLSRIIAVPCPQKQKIIVEYRDVIYAQI